MYVKKGWYGLLLVLLLLFVTVMSCNRQIQQTPDLSNKNKPVQTEVKQINTIDESETGKIPVEGKKSEYGTYFSKMSSEYAWLDTLTLAHLEQNNWIEHTKDERNKNTEETLHLRRGHFTKTFTDMLPAIPIDSFMMYTAHWYGIDNDFTFNYRHREYNYRHKEYKYNSSHQYIQYYKGRIIKNHITKITFDEKSKPTRIKLKIARNLNIAMSKKPFPYDSLYVMASDSLRDMGGLTLDEYNKRWLATGKMEGTPEYNKQNPSNKYNSKNHFDEILMHNDQYYQVHYVKVHATHKNYQFFFDANNYKLIDFINTRSHCFNSLCPNSNDRKELDNNLEIYYYGNQGDPIVQPAGTYVSRDNHNLGNIASTQTLKVLTCDANSNNISDNTEWKTLSLLGLSGNGTLQLDYLVAPDPPTFCWDDNSLELELYNTYYFSLYKSHQFFNDFNGSLIQSSTGSNEVRLTIQNQASQGNNAAAAFSIDDSFFGINLGTGKNGNSPFATLDLVGHEYMHGIIETVKTESFVKSGETYALLEGFCDIFGFMVERAHTGANDYVIMNHARVDENRNMADPFSSIPQAQPLYYNGRYWNISDDGHHRCGVLNYWFYVLTNDGEYYPDKCNESTDLPLSAVNADKCQPIHILGMDTDKAAEIVFEAMMEISTDATFKDFRDEVLEAVAEQYNMENPLNICSDEYSKVYRAFQAVGLINNSSNDNELKVTPPCHVFGYQSPNEIDCPSNDNFFYTGDSQQGFQVQTGLNNFNFPLGNYLISVLTDSNLDGIFELISEDYIVEPADVNDHQIIVESIDNEDVLIKVIVKQLPLVNATPTDDASSLTYVYFTFSINMQCSLISSDGSSPPTGPESNTGSITLNVSQDISSCINQEVCIDYDVTGPDYMFVSIDKPEDFFHIISQAGSNGIGQFCWYPNINDVGTHNFLITATDGHPTQPITQTSSVTVYVTDYASSVYSNTSPTFSKTNESSAGANNGSVTIGLSSTYTLEYHWSGPGISAGTVTYNTWANGDKQTGLGDGTYTVDVYIYDTECIYGSYSATVGTNSSSNSGCSVSNLIFMRAVPAIFNDKTTIEIELTDRPLQMSLVAFTTQGTPVQKIVNGQILGVGTHYVDFDGSNEPNGLYIFQLAVSDIFCRSGEQENISIKGFKY